MLKPDWSFFYQLLLFLSLAFLLNRILFRPLLGLLEARQKAVTSPLDEAERLRKEREEMEAKVRAQIEEASAQAEEIRNRCLKDASSFEREIITQARKYSETFLEDMRQKIQAHREAALAELEDEIQSHARYIAEALLGRRL